MGTTEIRTAIRLARLNKQIGQRELAKRTGLTIWRVRRIEQGIRDPRPDELAAIERVLFPREHR